MSLINEEIQINHAKNNHKNEEIQMNHSKNNRINEEIQMNYSKTPIMGTPLTKEFIRKTEHNPVDRYYLKNGNDKLKGIYDMRRGSYK